MKDEDEIQKLIGKYTKSIKRTRKNRIAYSERLKKYSQRWKIISFGFNIQAIFLIIWSLTYQSKTVTLVSAFFAIYVILLQYFINELNYSERSLKAHYHQLELRDLILSFQILEKKIKYKETTDALLNEVSDLMRNYQVSLKNNENHSRRDDIVNINKKEGYTVFDFSIDNLFIWFNFIICLFMIGFIGFIFF